MTNRDLAAAVAAPALFCSTWEFQEGATNRGWRTAGTGGVKFMSLGFLSATDDKLRAVGPTPPGMGINLAHHPAGDE